MILFRSLFVLSLLSGMLLLSSCQDQEEIDTEYPVIDADFAETFPQQCSILTKGETFTFTARFTDNIQLGSFSIDIHHNFDHHTHSTEVEECDMAPVREPENPLLFIRNYPIPEGQQEYVAEFEMEIPEDVDSGDYHLMILLTDHEGWQTIRGLSIKIE